MPYRHKHTIASNSPPLSNRITVLDQLIIGLNPSSHQMTRLYTA
uniref:Uncharacterized protein n=1 Tax=Rhizophora mucronata TaxID=61149 RepID=A0A2P2R4L4_RHIMU